MGFELITTSRYPSGETRKKARELATENTERYLARGKKTIRQLAEWARRNGEEIITILEERNNMPDKIVKIKVSEMGKWAWV